MSILVSSIFLPTIYLFYQLFFIICRFYFPLRPLSLRSLHISLHIYITSESFLFIIRALKISAFAPQNTSLSSLGSMICKYISRLHKSLENNHEENKSRLGQHELPNRSSGDCWPWR